MDRWMKAAAKEIADRVAGETISYPHEFEGIIARHSPGWVKIEEGNPETWESDEDLARGLAGIVIRNISDYLGLKGCEIDMDQETHRMRETIKEFREEFEVPAPPSEGETRK